MRHPYLLSAVLLLAPSAPSQLQSGPLSPGEILNAADEAQRQARIALTGDLGFAPLPPVRADSPNDTILFADRRPVGQDTTSYDSIPGGTYVDIFVPKTTTGTGIFEIAKAMLPYDYDAGGAPYPLVVAYHGFGSSAASVATQSTIDDECNARGMLYLSVTGMDDQLFGSPLCQKNTQAAIQWMLDHYHVDADRIYMVGFSMGGGIVSNFAARHRDPDGIMIAAVGTVSATLDWAQEYSLGNATIQSWMQNNYNFGGSPTTQLFAYQQASALYHVLHSYPPMPGTLVPELSMTQNLLAVPTYITYDVDDSITYVPVLNDEHETFLSGLGVATMKRVQSGTLDPDSGLPAPHSWAVLDETELFDFFDGKVVDRHPEDFGAQLDLGGAVSWVETTQRTAGVFTYVDGQSDPVGKHLTLSNVQNASQVSADVGLAGITGTLPVRVTATSADAGGFQLRMTGFGQTPCYVVQHGTNTLVSFDSDPSTGSLVVQVGPNTTLDLDVVHDPKWTTVYTSTPNPAPQGSMATVTIDGPRSSTQALWVIAVYEILTPVKGVTMTAFPGTPAILVPLPLDGNGDITFGLNIPVDPLLEGIRVPTQAVTIGAGGVFESVSNHWALRVQ
ncbi:MAG: alpha/beta fold hydrolase [Planctomycetes bacterium]|nr:alpha/beta fold hydrolase [Planctomycetota bacterium]